MTRSDGKLEIRGSGQRRRRRRYTHYQAEVSQVVPDGFAVSTEGFGSKIGKFFGMQDVETGVEGFDYVFTVKARDPAQAREFVQTPGVADALLDFQNHHTDMTLKRGLIEICNTGADDTRTIEHTLDRMVHLAKAQNPWASPRGCTGAPDNGACSAGSKRPLRSTVSRIRKDVINHENPMPLRMCIQPQRAAHEAKRMRHHH